MQAQPTKPPRRVKTKAPGIYRSISGSYEIAYRDSDGKLRFKTQPKGASLQEAKAARADVVSKLGKGERVAPTRKTFEAWSEEWLAGLNKRPRTIIHHRYALDKHLLPRFKRRKLAEISTDDVARLVAEMQRAGYAGWTITGTLSTLSGCLGKAKRRGLIPANPVRELTREERPSIGDAEKRVLSEKEISLVLEQATDQFRPLIAVMTFAGLRIGEALALRWKSIDFEGGFLHVRQQLTRERELAELKTSSGRRDVVLIPQLAKMLREHRMASLHKQPDDFLFPAPGGRGRAHRSTARAVERTFERAGLAGQGLSSHNLRHTYASLLIVGLKLDPVGVAAQLGHSNPATTLRLYSHLYDRAKHADETRDKLAAGFGHLLATKEAR
jgi:integrase